MVAGFWGGEAFYNLRINLHFLVGQCPRAVSFTRVCQPSSLPSYETGRMAGARFTHLSSPQVTGSNRKGSHEGRSLSKEEEAPCVFQNASSLACSLPLPWTPGGESSCKIHHENLVKLLEVKLTEDLAPQWFLPLKPVHTPVISEPGFCTMVCSLILIFWSS